MYRCLLYPLILLFVCNNYGYSQVDLPTVKRHRMIIQLSGLRHISKNEWTDVEHWAERHVGGPLPRIFTAKNTNGFQAGAYYEYTNKKGYTFSPGLLFGLEQQDYRWDFSFKYFDSTLDMSNVK